MYVVGDWFCSLSMTIKLSRFMSENRSPIKSSNIYCIEMRVLHPLDDPPRGPSGGIKLPPLRIEMPHTAPQRPFLGLWRECVRGTKGNRSASPQVVRRKRPMRRPLSGKRRESPLTAGGGARNISPCAADGRKRRGGALGAPGTLKTGYRGKRIGTRAGPPPAKEPAEISDERPIPSRGPTQGPGPSFRWLFLYYFELKAPLKGGARTKSLILAQDERWRRA